MDEFSNAANENYIYKDIVIVGNGPAGICLSYMLNGNWPYYTGEPHPGDEMLTARLNYIKNKQKNNNIKIQNDDDDDNYNIKIMNNNNNSLLNNSKEDFEMLTGGLEGRGTCKPMALLLDQLQHPCVDTGLDLKSLLIWKSSEYHPDHNIINHIVLGKGPPGGAWQFMDPNVLTISLTRWMSLPGLDLRKWETLVETEQLRKSEILQKRIVGDNIIESDDDTFEISNRIPVGTVAAYYKNYVHRMGLEKYFKCGRTVTSVRPIIDTNNSDDNYGWIVKGYENQSGRKFNYKCKKVVLATGTTNSSNRLGIPGEELQSSWITHDLNDLESRLDRLAGKCKKCFIKPRQGTVDPVLIIGAGLSAADAIMAARFRGIPVIHAFRDCSNSTEKINDNDDDDNGVRLSASSYERLQSLPVSMYPEYHKIYEMMADGKNHRFYKALPGYSLIDFCGPTNNDGNKKKERKVSLKSPSGQIFTFKVSTVAVLIGSKPDLSYLGEYATKLGKIYGKPIDGRSNPIEIDDITYEVIKSPKKGLYAMGPLVGDNFVRFIVGGAFAIASHLINNHEDD